MASQRRPLRLLVGEIELMNVLWREKQVTIAQAHRSLGKPIGYTTVQTRLNRLVAKGVAVKSAERPARYSAAVRPEDVSEHDLNVLVERVSGGRIVPLVAHLVRQRDLSSSEIRELKDLIDEAERRERGGKEEGR